MARRKIHLPVVTDDDFDFGFKCTGSPLFTGDASTDVDLVCGKCSRTLFVALTRDAAKAKFIENLGFSEREMDRLRKMPLHILCDCGAVNKLMPDFVSD